MNDALLHDEPPSSRDLVVARGVVEGDDVLVISYAREPAPSLDSLSPAEHAIVEAVLRGCPNAEIARMRGTSPLPVAKQIASAMCKLGVRTRGELAALASGRHRAPPR